MSTRRARFGDHWRKVFHRNYAVRYLRLNYCNVRGLQDSAISFSTGVTAIVGGNGAGKSTLAHAIIEVLAGSIGVPQLQISNARLHGSSLTATLQDEEGEQQLTLSLNETGQRTETGQRRVEFQWLDPSTMASLSQAQVLNDPNFSDVLESIGPRELKQTELASASYVVGKDYEKCEVYEIREYGPFEVWPYFRVTSNGVVYGSEDMGRGELAVLIALWAIDTAQRNSILVLEEPETYVSARSQSALMDLIAWGCSTKGMWTIITTHSSVVLQRLPKENIRLLVNERSKSRLISSPNLHEVASVVGGGTAYKTLILVEDECALCFVHALIERIDPDLQRQCVIQKMSGEAPISSILSTLPKISGWTKIVGCFDGDMRDTITGKHFHWPHVFLPGSTPPDGLLRATVTEDSPENLASLLHLPTQTISVALSNAAGLDTHDWLPTLSEQTGRRMEEIVRSIVGRWLTSHEQEAINFLHELKMAIDT